MVGLVFASRGQWDLAAGWSTHAVLAFFFFFSTTYLQITFRTHSDFARLSTVKVLCAGSGVLLVSAVWTFDYYGLCLRALSIELFALALLWHWRPVRVVPRWAFADLLHLLKIGAPIFAAGMAYSWWTVLMNTLIVSLLGTEGFGLFTVALMSQQALAVLPMALMQITYPRLSEMFGRDNEVPPLIHAALKPTLLLTLCMIPICALAWILLPPVTELLLPKYIGGVRAAQWAVLIPALSSLEVVNNVFVSTGNLKPYFLAIVAGVFSSGVALFLLISDGPSLEEFPQAMIVGRLIFLIICYLSLWRIWHAHKVL